MLLGNGSMTRKLAENILFMKRLTIFFYQHFAAGLRKGYGELLIFFFTSQTIRAYCALTSLPPRKYGVDTGINRTMSIAAVF